MFLLIHDYVTNLLLKSLKLVLQTLFIINYLLINLLVKITYLFFTFKIYLKNLLSVSWEDIILQPMRYKN